MTCVVYNEMASLMTISHSNSSPLQKLCLFVYLGTLDYIHLGLIVIHCS